MNDLFQEIIEFPDRDAERKYESLVGIDEIKSRLYKEAKIALNPQLLDNWSNQHYDKVVPLVLAFKGRPPLFLFEGDVGTGKTSLAECFGAYFARREKIPVTLYRLSLKARGRGAVGEMTQLISSAFSKIKEASKRGFREDQTASSAIVFVIDEADAIAQSREFSQMHHEDRAGVNSLIRGIDELTELKGMPTLVIMCTNRLSAIDPAVRRRAAAVFAFTRPNFEQRKCLLQKNLNGLGFIDSEIEALATLTGENEHQSFGFTYSDLVQSIFPALILNAFPDNPITYQIVVETINSIMPTPPFNDS